MVMLLEEIKMSDQKFLKITYHVGSADKTKINAYLLSPSPFYAVLLNEIGRCIFYDHKQPETIVRTYWIDEHGDEIEAVNQSDYEIFMRKQSEQHLQIAPIQVAAVKDSEAETQNDTEKSNPSAKIIHSGITCDVCNISPILGFNLQLTPTQVAALKDSEAETPNDTEKSNPSAKIINISPILGLKLQLTPTQVAASKDSETANDTEEIDPIAKIIHPGITCDVCRKSPIVGFRYKCFQCPDYDLCEKCEMKHIHAQHLMVRITNSRMLKNVLFCS